MCLRCDEEENLNCFRRVVEMSQPEKEDLTTFTGRLWHFIKVTDPSTLIYSDKAVLESKSVLDSCNQHGMQCGSDEEMSRHKRIVDAAIHPSTGEIIPRLFRK